MSYIKGGDLMVFMDGVSVAGATNHTLNISAETNETSTKTKDEADGAWSEVEVSTYSWEATTENLVTFTNVKGKSYLDLFEAMTSAKEVDLVFGYKEGDAVPDTGWVDDSTKDPILSGKAVITSLEMTATDGELASFTATFTGVGKLTKTAASA